MADLDQARAAKQRLRAELGRREGIAGVGLARTADGYRLVVNLSDPSAGATVPESVDGVDVRVRQTGPVTAQT